MAEVQPQRDPDFYFSFRTFQVEDTLFRVPKHLFPIQNASLLPIPHGAENDDDLVVLGEGINKKDFLQLLRAVYPRQYDTPENLSSTEWQVVLALSETLGLGDVRRKAIKNLKDTIFAGDPVEALLCAQRNNLDDWIAPLIDTIVKTERHLSEKELVEVGIPIAMKIAWAQGAAGNPIQEPASTPLGGAAEFEEWGLPPRGKRGKKRGNPGKHP